MTAILIAPFYGMLPRIAPRQLPESRSVDATNVILTSGEIRAMKNGAIVTRPSVSGPWISIYRAEHEQAQKWLAWNRDVDIVRAPLSNSIEPRYYWTGDAEPRYATFSGLPNIFYALGVPKPQTAPMVAHTGGTGVATSRVYVYTFYTALNEESAPSLASALTTGRVDGTWAITGMNEFPVSSGTGTVAFANGISTFNNGVRHWLRVGDEILFGITKVLVASVPSPTTFTVAGNFTGATSWSRVAPWNTVGMKRRLYRSTGTTGAFQLVADDVGTSYNDTLTDAQILGDELISFGWETPPTNLAGMLSTASGALSGFFSNQLCFSEPFQPHAWVTAFRKSTESDIVGTAAFGTTVVAGTAGRPYICDGVEPAVATLEAIDKAWPCLSKRSMVAVGDGALYATSYGMAYIGLSGATIWTEQFFSRTEWRPLMPESMVCAVSQGQIFVRFNGKNGQRGVMVYDMPDIGLGMRLLSNFPDELYGDLRNGFLYFSDVDGIKIFDSEEGVRTPYSWRSKVYHLAKTINLGCAKVDFSDDPSMAEAGMTLQLKQAVIAQNESTIANYAGFGSLNGSGMTLNSFGFNQSTIKSIPDADLAASTFTLYCNDVPVYSRALTANQKAFRLPAGFKTDNIAIGLTGTLRIKSVKLAETMSELKAI